LIIQNLNQNANEGKLGGYGGYGPYYGGYENRGYPERYENRGYDRGYDRY